MVTAPAPSPGDKKPIDPAKRRRLQQMFEHGSKSSAKGDFKYATEMFTQCVLGDPGNLVYVSNFLGNLQKQYNNNKSGSKMASISGMGIKGSIKKASMQKDWNAVLVSGLEMLKLNPWDASTCAAMAVACEHLEYDDCQLAYLKGAMDANIADPDLNRLAGRANGRLGRYDDAIACWARVAKAKPADQEAQRAIGDLTVEKTISKGGYEDAKSTKEIRNKDDEPAIGLQLTPEQKLQKAIAKDPSNSGLYLQLSDLYISKENFSKAEEILQQALQASGGEINVRERLEDVQLRRLRGQIEIAKKKATEDKTPENVALYEKLMTELNSMEMQVYRSRCDRYPANLGFRFQLGLRLQRAKMYAEAIKAYQEARNDPQKKGEVLLNLGECFHYIKKFELAMGNYEQAIVEIAGKDDDLLKLALYRAGKLALGLKLTAKAHKYLTDLADRDYGYKDVAECLDKVQQLRDKGGSSEDQPSP